VKPQELRDLNVDGLQAKQHELQEQLFKLRLQKSLGQLDNPMKMRETRRDIARVNTVLKEKGAAQAASK
jgi:large subunit ribosomal protein L29